jgi:hypothetical protein
LPADDLVANSMYGGTQQLFQQPVAAMPMPLPMPQPVVQQPVITPGEISDSVVSGDVHHHHYAKPVVAGPPIPAAGIPVGWTMEQWQHYGQQYLEDNI